MSRAHPARVALLALIIALGTVAVAPATASALDADSFCDAFATLQANPTDDAVYVAQANRMVKAKPPKNVVKALAVVKSVAQGKRSSTDAKVAAATSTINSYVGEQCSEASGGTDRRCPITVEQASAVVGEPLDATGSCTFFPADDAWPNVVFVRQSSIACKAEYLDDLGYSESLDGLGERAYVNRESSSGASILVCTKDPFEVSVDLPSDGAAALAAAQQLAREVLADE